MKHVLIYGDSNSWGYLDDGSGLRYAKRWPKVMARKLADHHNQPIALIEEALPGRTTAYPDPQEGPEYNGLPYLKPALLSHAPLDLVMIMLGTNDCKVRFGASADEITNNMITLAKIVRRSPTGPGKWRDAPAPQVMIIAPPALGTRADDPHWIRYDEWEGGRDKSLQFGALISAKLSAHPDHGFCFFDAGQIITSSDKDPIHWSASTHEMMGNAIADKVADIMADIKAD